ARARGLSVCRLVPDTPAPLAAALPALLGVGRGRGALFGGVQAAATAGAPADKAGLAAALGTASGQLGSVLGLAIFTAIATSHTQHLLTSHVTRAVALTSGFHYALVACSIFLVAAAVIASRAANAKHQPAQSIE